MRKDEARFFIKAIMLSKQFFIATVSVMGLLALVCLTCVFFRFIGIGEFEIKGETDYKLSELVSASGLRTGDRLYEVNEKEAEELLLRGCPYLKSSPCLLRNIFRELCRNSVLCDACHHHKPRYSAHILQHG